MPVTSDRPLNLRNGTIIIAVRLTSLYSLSYEIPYSDQQCCILRLDRQYRVQTYVCDAGAFVAN
jgi:hypothetical protein